MHKTMPDTVIRITFVFSQWRPLEIENCKGAIISRLYSNGHFGFTHTRPMI
jgi:hypothetical protein